MSEQKFHHYIFILLFIGVTLILLSHPVGNTGCLKAEVKSREARMQIHKALMQVASQLAEAVGNRDIEAYLSHFVEDEKLKKQARAEVEKLFESLKPDDIIEGYGWGRKYHEATIEGLIEIRVKSGKKVTRCEREVRWVQKDNRWFIASATPKPPKYAYTVYIEPKEIYSFDQFAIKQGDFHITVESGLFAPGHTEVGVTAAVVIGEGRLEFKIPPAQAERVKARFESAEVTDTFDVLFFRFHPEDYPDLIKGMQLSKVEASEEQMAQAQNILDADLQKSYHFNEYAAIPPRNTMIIDIHTKQHELLHYVNNAGEVMIFGFPHFGTHISYSLKKSKSGGTIAEADSGEVDILHYRILAEIAPEAHLLTAETSIQLHNSAENLEEIHFALRDNLKVESVMAKSGENLEYQRGDELTKGQLKVQLASPLQKGEQTELSIKYRGEIFGPLAGRSGRRLWDCIGPEGSYVRPESRWYPSRVGDWATAELTFKVPKGLQAVSNGVLAEVTSDAERDVFKWESENPIAALAFTVAQYEKKTDVFNGIEIACYTFPEHAHRAEDFVWLAKDVLGFYSDRFGEYRFPKFAIVEIPESYGGGHGDTSFIMLYARAFREDIKRQTEFIAHEISHQWWGNSVGALGDEEWLSEGFANYSASLYAEHALGKDAFQKRLKRMAEAYLIGMAKMRGKDEPLAFTHLNHVIYNKGAYVLHMLRYLIGDEKFFEVLSTYVKEYSGKNASSFDLQRVVERVSGEDLKWFFVEWVKGVGAPKYSIESSIQGQDGKFVVAGTIVQEEGNFRMPLEVVVKTKSGEISKRIWVEGTPAEFEITTDTKPLSVELDPKFWVLRKMEEALAKLNIDEQLQQMSRLFREAPDVAIEKAKAILAIDPDNAQALSTLGRIYHKQDKPKEAEVCLNRALQIEPKSSWVEAWTRYTLGLIYQDRGEKEKAIAEFKKVIEMQATRNSVKAAQKALVELEGN